MNLTNEEIAAFLVILLKKNPIIDISIDGGEVKFKRFDGQELTQSIEFPEQEPIVLPNFDDFKPQEFDFEQFEEQINQKLSAVQTTISEQINSIPEYQLPVDDIKQLIENAIVKYTENLDKNVSINLTEVIDDKKSIELEQIVNQQLDLIKDSIVSLQDFSQESSQTTNKLQNENTALHKKLSNFYHELKEDVKSIIEKQDLVTEESSNTIKYLENFINTKLDQYKQDQTAKRYIEDILIKGNRLTLHYSDNTHVDFTDLFIPLVRDIVSPLIRSRAYNAGSGAGGYGGGSPGLSAYDIAVRNGFLGTESQWLQSLQGSSIPSDGTISYDLSGRIDQIITGNTTTTISRDIDGNILSIHKDNYTKVLIRENNRITGWTVVFDG